MEYDLKIAPRKWAFVEAHKRIYDVVPDDIDNLYASWKLCSSGLKHLAYMIALYEQPPIDPIVIKARKIYNLWYLSDLPVEDNTVWAGIRENAINSIISILEIKD